MKRTPLRKMSKSKAREYRKYIAAGPSFFERHEFCEVPQEVHDCTIRATQRHHMKGQRGELMNDEQWILAACMNGHAWIEANKKRARKMGLILYK